MKGLIIKDFRILGQQKNLFVIYLVMAIVLGFSMDGTFLVTYFPLIGFFLVLSTISLDNFDNGMAFLMTLPTSGKLYALEKYVIGSVIAIGTWAFAAVLQFGMFFIKKEAFVTSEVLSMDLAIIPILLLAIAIMIPIDIKFGTEKGRLVMFVITGIFFMIFLGGKAALNYVQENMGLDIQAIINGIKTVPVAALIAGALLIVSLLLAGSIMLTISCFKIYDIVYMLAGGSNGVVNKSAIVLVYYIYEEAFRNWKLGSGSAAALVLFAIVLVVTLIQFRGEKNYAND